MKSSLFAGLAALAFAAAPATAATVLNPGDTVNLNFDGLVEGVVVPGLTGSLALKLDSISGQNLNFSYTLSNTSGGGIGSRISTFGFNILNGTLPNSLNGSSATGGDFTNVAKGNVPQFGQVDFCVTAGPNCAGGSGDGIVAPSSQLGSFVIKLSSAAVSTVELDDFYVRYQSITGTQRGTSGTGRVTTPPDVPVVPEPATWAMLIAGFGLVGSAMRRRRGVATVSA